MRDTLIGGALWLSAVGCLGWTFVLLRVWYTIAALRRLPAFAPPAEAIPAGARVSAVLDAGEETRSLERAVRSLLLQEGVEMQVVVVSRGDAGAAATLLSRLSSEDSRVVPLHTDKLPKGWIAGNYALELGQGRADGDYLLFTEPRVFHGRRAVYNAVRVLEEEGLDHVAVHPRLEAGHLWEALVLPLLVLIWEFRFVARSRAQRKGRAGTGVSAFNLVRAETYRLRGTHARIRGSLLADRDLGRMMREEGGRGAVLRAVSQVRVRPYRSFRELYAGIRRATLVSARESPLAALWMGLMLGMGGLLPPLCVAFGMPLALAGHGPWAGVLAAITWVVPAIALVRARTMVRFEPTAALFFPVGAALIGISTIHAALLFAVRGRIEWSGRHYSRRELRDSLD